MRGKEGADAGKERPRRKGDATGGGSKKRGSLVSRLAANWQEGKRGRGGSVSLEGGKNVECGHEERTAYSKSLIECEGLGNSRVKNMFGGGR